MSPIKIVVLGSCRYEPYEVLAMPNKLDPELYEEDHEKAYDEACKVFYPAIDEADLVLVYAPEGIGEHTGRDLDYAKDQGKDYVVFPHDVNRSDELLEWEERVKQCRRVVMELRRDLRILDINPKNYMVYPLTTGFVGLIDYILTGDPDKIAQRVLKQAIELDLEKGKYFEESDEIEDYYYKKYLDNVEERLKEGENNMIDHDRLIVLANDQTKDLLNQYSDENIQYHKMRHQDSKTQKTMERIRKNLTSINDLTVKLIKTLYNEDIRLYAQGKKTRTILSAIYYIVFNRFLDLAIPQAFICRYLGVTQPSLRRHYKKILTLIPEEEKKR